MDLMEIKILARGRRQVLLHHLRDLNGTYLPVPETHSWHKQIQLRHLQAKVAFTAFRSYRFYAEDL